MGLFGGTQVKTNKEETRKNLVRNVIAWIVVVTARYSQPKCVGENPDITMSHAGATSVKSSDITILQYQYTDTIYTKH